MSLHVAYAMKKRMAKGGMMTEDGYQSECTEHCESPCMVHPQASGYEMHEEDHMRPNHMAMEQDDRMLDQHGDDEMGPEGRHMAEGGHVKGINRQHENRREGTSEAGHYAKYQTSSGNSDGSKDWTNDQAKKSHHKTIAEMRSMPKPNLPMADGGFIGSHQSMDHEEDMVGRVMKKRQHMYSKGGQVANDTPPEADFEENQFDDLVKDDELESHFDAKNSGDMDGNEYGADHDDMIARVMMKRRKQHNPNPA